MVFNLNTTLEKMKQQDNDYRYMATLDLLNEMESGGETFKLDSDGERRLSTALLRLLEDSNGDVQGLAVRCLGPLIKAVKERQATEIIEHLLDQLLREVKVKKESDDNRRDIISMGLKLVVANLPEEAAQKHVRKITPRLVQGLTADEKITVEVKLECLDILSDVLSAHGSMLADQYEKILRAVLPHLASSRTTARKRTIQALGHLSSTLPDAIFSEMVQSLLDGAATYEKKGKTAIVRSYVQSFSTVSRAVGYRLGKFIDAVVDMLARNIGDFDAEEYDDELREACIQTCEALILRCPQHVGPHQDKIRGWSVEFLKYDPNWQVMSDEESEDDMDDDDDDDEDWGSDGEDNYSDDEDMSWKVRRSCAKCLCSIITANQDEESLKQHFEELASPLISRFSEREENVRLEVFKTFESLLRVTSNRQLRQSSGSPGSAVAASTLLTDEVTSAMVKRLVKQLKDKSVRTRVGVFVLLRELLAVKENALEGHFGSFTEGVKFSLGDKNSSGNLKIETLHFLRVAFARHTPTIVQPHVANLVDPLLKMIGESYYKITAEALRATCELVRVLRPSNGDEMTDEFDSSKFVGQVWEAVFEKLQVQNVDQEVKEVVITCMGLIISQLGNLLTDDQRSKSLDVLLERLKSEVTRLVTVKVFDSIASAQLKANLTDTFVQAVPTMGEFLRKNNRALRQNALIALNTIIQQYHKDKEIKPLFKKVLPDTAALLRDTDLHLAHLTLKLDTSIIHASRSSVSDFKSNVWSNVLQLLKSSLLQGPALESVLDLVRELVAAGSKTLSFDNILESLLDLSNDANVTKQALVSISRCIAAMAIGKGSDEKRQETVTTFVNIVSSGNADVKRMRLALRTLGEIGRHVDLSTSDNVQTVLFSVLDRSEEDVKSAASFAIGSVAIGNMPHFLPGLLAHIDENPSMQYLLLHALREVIVICGEKSDAKKALLPHFDKVLPLLFSHCESSEEGTRNVVAECLGKLALIRAKDIVPMLEERVSNDAEHVRATVITALKSAVSANDSRTDKALQPKMGKFVDMLKDTSLVVRRATLMTINYIAHNKPSLLADIMPSTLEMLYGETVKKPELIREVDLGPFKHKVDDGLELRKAAYECIYTVLDKLVEHVEIGALVEHLVSGLRDEYDIKLLCHLILVRTAHGAGANLLERLDLVVEPLRVSITQPPAESSVKQDMERNEELVRTALRAIAAISQIPNVDSVSKWQEFMKNTVMVDDLGDKFNEIVRESESSLSRHNDGGVRSSSRAAKTDSAAGRAMLKSSQDYASSPF